MCIKVTGCQQAETVLTTGIQLAPESTTACAQTLALPPAGLRLWHSACSCTLPHGGHDTLPLCQCCGQAQPVAPAAARSALHADADWHDWLLGPALHVAQGELPAAIPFKMGHGIHLTRRVAGCWSLLTLLCQLVPSVHSAAALGCTADRHVICVPC